MIAVDLTEFSEKILNEVKKLARAHSAKAHRLHVAEPEPDFVGFDVGPQTVRDTPSKSFHAEHRQLQAIAEQLRSAGLDTTALLVQGDTAETILKEASKLDADMIVVGSHGRRAMRQLLVGSVRESALRKIRMPGSCCPDLTASVETLQRAVTLSIHNLPRIARGS